MQCWSSHLPVLALLLLGGHALGQVLGEGGDTSIGETTIENSESKELLLPSPKSASEETDSSPARQRPQQGGSWGGLLSGLLGTITKTADVSDCPGKCLHALASLLCEEVKEEITCPSQSMRCCVDRKHLKNPPQNPEGGSTDNNRLETTTNYRVRPVPARTTTKATTTTTKPTTTRRPNPAVASDKQDKFGDYDYTDSTSDTSSASTTSKNTATTSVFFAAVLCMNTFYFL